MRTALSSRKDIRCQYIAVIERFSGRLQLGRSRTEYIRTICLNHIKDAETGEYLADHVWIDAPRAMLSLKEGDHVRFTAIVSPYRKQGKVDYHLTCLARVELTETFSEG